MPLTRVRPCGRTCLLVVCIHLHHEAQIILPSFCLWLWEICYLLHVRLQSDNACLHESAGLKVNLWKVVRIALNTSVNATVLSIHIQQPCGRQYVIACDCSKPTHTIMQLHRGLPSCSILFLLLFVVFLDLRKQEEEATWAGHSDRISMESHWTHILIPGINLIRLKSCLEYNLDTRCRVRTS